MEINPIEDKLIAYLRDKLKNPRLGYEETLTPLKGGCDTNMYRFKLSGVQKELTKPLVLRLYPSYYEARDVVLENTIQNVLAEKGFQAARTYFICTDMTILGGLFFIMEFLYGNLMVTAPLEAIPEMLGQAHAALHKLDPEPGAFQKSRAQFPHINIDY